MSTRVCEICFDLFATSLEYLTHSLTHLEEEEAN